jgi:hypothetical protein
MVLINWFRTRIDFQHGSTSSIRWTVAHHPLFESGRLEVHQEASSRTTILSAQSSKVDGKCIRKNYRDFVLVDTRERTKENCKDTTEKEARELQGLL